MGVTTNQRFVGGLAAGKTSESFTHERFSRMDGFMNVADESGYFKDAGLVCVFTSG